VAIEQSISIAARGSPVNFSVAMIVLRKMAIIALHSFFQMNVREVHRFAETVRIINAICLPSLSSNSLCGRD